MRRLVVLLVFILVLAPVLPAKSGLLPAARAASSHLPLAGGIAGQYDYQEYNFLTGLPLLLQGQIKVKINAGRDNTTKTTVSLSKVTTFGDLKNTLSRNTTFLEIGADREDQGQTVHSSQAEKISESVKFNNLYVNGEKTGNLKFDLLDGQLSKSVVVDKHPVVNFFSGNFEGRKIYNVNNGAGRLTVDISGTTVGYDHNWGRSETQRLTQLYQYTPLNPKATDPVWKEPWDGQVDYVINLSTDRELSYQPNDPANISFSGGYLISETGTSAVVATYNLPMITAVIPEAENATRRNAAATLAADNLRRNEGTLQWGLTATPKLTRMYVPEYEDIRGHWAEPAINVLAGLKAWQSPQGFFGPDQETTRLDFVRALMQSLGVVAPEGPDGMIAYTAGYPNLPEPGGQGTGIKKANQGFTGTTGVPRSRQVKPEPLPFVDLPQATPGYENVKLALEKKVVQGISPTRFDPYGPITREQAATALVQALGLDTLAPAGQPPGLFYDDGEISWWAKDAVYVAEQLGILAGDPYGFFRPREYLSRADTASLLMNTIRFLQTTLPADYRDRILNQGW